jgi:hypothetical protein
MRIAHFKSLSRAPSDDYGQYAESLGRLGARIAVGSPRRDHRAAYRAICLAILLGVQCAAQNSPPIPPPPLSPYSHRSPADVDMLDSDPVAGEKRLRALNAERQKSLVSDTNKLLKLAQELEAEIGSENPGSLNPAQLHKIAEIEKLARSVKEKMSIATGPS